MTLLCDNRTETTVDEDILQAAERAAYMTLVYDEFDTECEVSLSFVTDGEIRDINKSFRGIDKATDVLSFPQIDYDTDEEVMTNEKGEIVLGDIIISLDTAQKQAEEYGHSLKREICFLTVHSMLHLLGYDHMTEEEEKEMFAKQKAVLDMAGIKR